MRLLSTAARRHGSWGLVEVIFTSGELGITDAMDDVFASFELLSRVRLMFFDGSGPGIKDRRREWVLAVVAEFAIMRERR